MSVIGIDFGSDSCYIAVARAGGIETIANDYSERDTPSFVAFGKRNRYLGVAAKHQQVTNISNTVYGFKRLLGRKFNDAFSRKEITYLPYSVCEMSDGTVGVKVTYLQKEMVFSIVQIVAMLFTKLKETVESALNTKVTRCVVSVPSYFSDAERRALLDSCTIAKLNVLRLMNETTAFCKLHNRKGGAAAALSYGFYKQDLSEKTSVIIVFLNIGYSTTEVSVCSFTKGKLQVLSNTWDTNVGGRDVDNEMSCHFAKEFLKNSNMDVLSDKRAIVRLIQGCEKLKKQLSADPQPLPLNIENLLGENDGKGRMGREEFDLIISDLLARIERTLQRALSEANISPRNVNAVELVGGSCRIPAIKSLVHKIFGRDPSTTLNLDEAVARGCALQCAMLIPTCQVKDYYLSDVQPYPIWLLWNGKEGEIEVFPKNHPVPYSKFLTFYRKEEFVLEAEYGDANEDPHPNKVIGQFFVKNVNSAAFKESVQIKVKVRIDIDGIFSVCSAVVNSEGSRSNGEVPNQKEEDLMDVDNKLSLSKARPSPQVSPRKEKEQPAQKKYRAIKASELHVETKVQRLSTDEIEKLIDDEVKMIEQEIIEKERIDAKNALEEYMYGFRSQLNDELQKFANDQECSNFQSRFEALENWLYEGGSDENKVVYEGKLSQLQESVEPILSRRKEHEERPAAVDDLRAVLTESENVIEKCKAGDVQFSNIEPQEIEKLQLQVNEVRGWMDNILPLLSQTECHQNPPVRVAEIVKETKSLQNMLTSVLGGAPQQNSSGASRNNAKGDTCKHSPTKRQDL